MRLLFSLLFSLAIAFPAIAQNSSDLLDDFEKDLVNPVAKTTPKAAPGSLEERLQKVEDTIAEWSKFGEISKVAAEEPYFIPNDDNEGIYPDISVLNDPFNPYKNADYGSLDVQKWGMVGSKNPEKDFYIWATLLALGPNGENQFYTAMALRNAKLNDMAMRAYQAVLDYFPDAVSYTKEGYKWLLADAASQAIIEMGGKPRKAVRAPFKISGGNYTGLFQMSSLNEALTGTTNNDAWAIGQRHELELNLTLTPSKELSGTISFKIQGSKPSDIEPSKADRNVGEESHYGAYVNRINLQYETKYFLSTLYKSVAIQSWDDVLDIHPRLWDVTESQGRGWGFPSGFSLQEKLLPYDTKLYLEAGPAPNGNTASHTYFVKATPTIGPITLMLARRGFLQGVGSLTNNIYALDDYNKSAIYLNGANVDTLNVKANVASVQVEGQVMLNEPSKDMIYTNRDGASYAVYHTYKEIWDTSASLADMFTYAGRVRYNADTSKSVKRLPLNLELSAIYAGKWVFNGNKMEVNADIYGGPFSYFLFHLSGFYRMNLVAPHYYHPGTVFRDNRSGTKVDFSVTFDMTPDTLMRETWGDKLLTPYENAKVAVELGYTYENYPTHTDPMPREWGYGIYAYAAEPNFNFGLYPCTLHKIHGATVLNLVKDWKFTLNGEIGTKQALRGTQLMVNPWTEYFTVGLGAQYKNKTMINVSTKFYDWLDYMYDPIPTTWSPYWGITADQNIYVSLRQMIMSSYIELGYEYLVAPDVYADNTDPAHFATLKYVVNF